MCQSTTRAEVKNYVNQVTKFIEVNKENKTETVKCSLGDPRYLRKRGRYYKKNFTYLVSWDVHKQISDMILMYGIASHVSY